MATHATLVGADLHENKGVASASDNTVATAVSGVTVWRKMPFSSVDTSSIFNINKTILQCVIASVSVAETVFVTTPFGGTLTNVYAVLQGILTGSNGTITVANNAGAIAGTITVTTAGSFAGQKLSIAPVTNNNFVSGDNLSVATNGVTTGTAKLFVTLLFTVSA